MKRNYIEIPDVCNAEVADQIVQSWNRFCHPPCHGVAVQICGTTEFAMVYDGTSCDNQFFAFVVGWVQSRDALSPEAKAVEGIVS